MDLRRVPDLPPYVLGSIRELTLELRRGGADVVDLGFGNPDLASPAPAVAKLHDAPQTLVAAQAPGRRPVWFPDKWQEEKRCRRRALRSAGR